VWCNVGQYISRMLYIYRSVFTGIYGRTINYVRLSPASLKCCEVIFFTGGTKKEKNPC
jgi:hypothetical protein